jgi:hypothetical protein
MVAKHDKEIELKKSKDEDILTKWIYTGISDNKYKIIF